MIVIKPRSESRLVNEGADRRMKYSMWFGFKAWVLGCVAASACIVLAGDARGQFPAVVPFLDYFNPCPPNAPAFSTSRVPCPKPDGSSGEAASDSNPVTVLSGVLKESFTDVDLSGIGIDFKHVRDYRGVYQDQYGNWDLAAMQGENWEVLNLTWLIHEYIIVGYGSPFEMHVSSHATVLLLPYAGTYNAFGGSYMANGDSVLRSRASNGWRVESTHYRVPYAMLMEPTTELVGYSGTTTSTGDIWADNQLTYVDDSGTTWDFAQLAQVDDYKGCYVVYTTGPYAGEKRLITSSTKNVAQEEIYLNFDEPLPGNSTGKFHIVDRLLVEFKDSGYTYEMRGIHRNNGVDAPGILDSKTDRHGNKVSYHYDSDLFSNTGRITSATTSQGWEIAYGYVESGTNAGKLKLLEVKNESDQIVQRVRYHYWGDTGSESADCGSDGDLLLVENLSRASDDDLTQTADSAFSIKKYWHYRYYTNQASDGLAHQMKAIYDSDAVFHILDTDASLDTTNVADLLEEPDAYVFGGVHTVSDIASRSFIHHQPSFSTSSADTAWGGIGEDLETLYGGLGYNEDTYVKTETIRTGCGSCGSSGSQTVQHHFNYIRVGTGILMIQDTEAGGAPVRRTLSLADAHSRLIRKVVIEDPASPKYWCESWIFEDNTISAATADVFKQNTILEHRMPSSHAPEVATAADLRLFLRPEVSSNDGDTLSSSEGLIYGYEYDGMGHESAALVKQGSGGTFHLTSAQDYGDGSTNSPKDYVVARYRYPTKQVSANRANGDVTNYAYTFWGSDNLQVKTKTTTYPAVSTSQNGSGQASVKKEYFDERGKLRWRRDANGHVNYYSYAPGSGKTALLVKDVDTSSLGTEIVDGVAGKWVAWDDENGGDTVPAGFSSPASGTRLKLTTKTTYDDLGRTVSTTGPGGTTDYYAYGDDRRMIFPAWNAASNQSTLPVAVFDETRFGKPLKNFGVEPSVALNLVGGVPVGFTSEPSQDDYVYWMQSTYNENQQLEFTDRYHSIPSSGSGNVTFNYDRTAYLYDAQGRREYVIKTVTGGPTASGVEQITQTLYDDLDRVSEVKQGVSDSAHSIGLGYDQIPATLKTVRKVYYDGADDSTPLTAGDGHLTRSESYFADGTTEADRSTVLRHYDYRGRLRAVEAEESPRYTINDLDWSGRLLAIGRFTSAPGSWAGLAEDYAEATSSGRVALSVIEYDSWGRPFRSLAHGVVAGTGVTSKAIETLSFYDAVGNAVAEATTGGGGAEYAYDGANRMYQTRSVSKLSGQDGGSYFTSGAFNYQSPVPSPALADMTTGGDDYVLTLDHTALDDDGKVLSQHHWAVEHGDSGLSAATPDYIQSTTHFWFDDADRLIASAAYGTNGAGGAFEYASAPTRGAAPSASTDTVLLTELSYETSTGRVQDIVTPLGSGGSATTQVTRSVYDDLGRTIATIENYNNATVTPGTPGSPPTVVNSGGSTTDLDRVTVTQYNGLSQVVKLTAVDPNGDGSSSDNQDTLYLYEDAVNAAWLTHTLYPDSADTDSSGYDQVSRTYHLDGTVATLTKQKAAAPDTATVTTLDYDDARRATAQRVTTVGTDVDDSVRSIVTIYDGLGRVSSRRTYAESAPVVGTDTPLSDVAMTYGDYGELLSMAQSHSGEATTGTPEVVYEYDATDVGADGVLDHALRPVGMTYPNGREIAYDYSGNAGIDDLISRPGGLIEKTPGTLVAEDDAIVSYEYLGDGTLAVKDYPRASLRLDRFGQTAGAYAGYDRFGRTAQQRWETYDGSGADIDAVFDIAHGYDQASNRLNAVRSVYPLASQAYAHDGLNRLTGFDAGEYDSGNDEIEGLRKFDRRLWDLDQVGNQLSVESLEDPDPDYANPASDDDPYSASTFNAANEIDTRKVQASQRIVPGDDFEDSATASLWAGIAGASFTVDSGGSGEMGTSGSGTKLILFSEESAGSAALSTTVGPITANQYAGLVFGYQTTSKFYTVVFHQDGTFELRTATSVLATTSTTGLLKGSVTVSLTLTERGVVCNLQESGDLAGRGGGDGNDSAELSYAFPKGSPVGRVGVYTRPNGDATAITFDEFVWAEGSRSIALSAAWDNYSDNIAVSTSSDNLILNETAGISRRPVLLRGVRGDRFRADFAVYKSNDITQKLRFHFNAQDPEDSDYLVIPLADAGEAPSGYEVTQGKLPVLLSATQTDANAPVWEEGETLWVRVESDGIDLTVYQATSEAGLDSASACFETSGSTDRFAVTGGRLGFAVDTSRPEVDQVKVYLDLNADGDFADANELQHEETFTLDADRYAPETMGYDAAGNLTYDGVFRYVYDAWNRLVEVRKAVSSTADGATIASYRYDGFGKRITRQIQHSGDATITFHDYWSSSWQLLETRDGSGHVLKQHVWGLEYIDELIQIAVNQDVYIDTSEEQCERVYFVLQDAHYNVIGLTTAGGHLVERYEYTPYGQRKVFSQPQPLGDFDGDGKVGQADYDLYSANWGGSTASGTAIMYLDIDGSGTVGSAEESAVLLNWGQGYAEGDHVTRGMGRAARVENKDGLLAYAVNDFGHQGLGHDGETGLVYSRARYRDVVLGRWLQREPLMYIDGMSLYGFVKNQPYMFVDPSGLFSRWLRDWALGIDSGMLQRSAQMLADRANEIGRNDLAQKVLDDFQEFDDNVGNNAWESATTPCKRRIGESVGSCVKRLKSESDIQGQLLDIASNPLMNELTGLAVPSPIGPSDLGPEGIGVLTADMTAGAAYSFGRDFLADTLGNKKGEEGIRNGVRGAINLATGIDGGDATRLTKDIVKNYASHIAGQNRRAAMNAFRGISRGAGAGVAAYIVSEGTLYATAFAQCKCCPTLH